MLQTEIRLSSPDQKPAFPYVNAYSVPGKVFLLGEYAVLADQPALLAAVGPRFQLFAKPLGPDEQKGLGEFHPQSPISRLMDWSQVHGLPEFAFEFADPFQGQGGFGASTAQFVLAYSAMAESANWERDWQRVWKLYRELMSGTGLTPSGADIVAQWEGGVVCFDPKSGTCADLFESFDWSTTLVFSASGQPGRKVATHEHLAALAKTGFPSQGSLIQELNEPLKKGINAARRNSPKELGLAMNEYADVLHRFGLETAAAHEDRKALGELTDVLGVKGTGAMQSDALVVMVKPGSKNRAKIIQAAKDRDLVLVADGLSFENGVVCQN